MSDMVWRSNFDPSADAYSTPSLIKEYLKSHERYPSWDNDEVQQWFVDQGASKLMFCEYTRRC